MWGNEDLCKNWRCWPTQPTKPDECEYAPPLASELAAFGRDIQKAIALHDGFIARSVFVQDPDGGPHDTIIMLLHVVLDVFWMIHCRQFTKDAIPGEIAAMFADIVNKVVKQSTQSAAGATPPSTNVTGLKFPTPPKGTRLN